MTIPITEADRDRAQQIADTFFPQPERPALVSIIAAALAQARAEGEAAEKIIGEIEERFPNWRSYRDLIDCIDCTLFDLRRGTP